MSDSEFASYWAGYADTVKRYGTPLWGLIFDAEPNYLEEDIAFLASVGY